MALPSNTIVYGRILPNSSKNIVSSKQTKDIGFKYPIEDNGGKYFSKSSGIELIRTSIKNLIKTLRGERFMLPDYGCNLKRYLMETIDEALFNEIKTDISQSITKYLSKIKINKLQVFSNNDNSVINVKLFCNLRENESSNFTVDIGV